MSSEGALISHACSPPGASAPTPSGCEPPSRTISGLTALTGNSSHFDMISSNGLTNSSGQMIRTCHIRPSRKQLTISQIQGASRFCAHRACYGQCGSDRYQCPQRGWPPGLPGLKDSDSGEQRWSRGWSGALATPLGQRAGGEGTQPGLHPWNSGLCRIQRSTVLIPETRGQEGTPFSQE